MSTSRNKCRVRGFIVRRVAGDGKSRKELGRQKHGLSALMSLT